MILAEDNTGLRFREILEGSEKETVEYPGHTVSQKPLYSHHYMNCNGIVLLDHRVACLSHYNRTNWGTPEEIFDRLLEEMLKADRIEDLTAVLIGGDVEHFLRNERCLEVHEIPIVGEYLDGWTEGLIKIEHPEEVRKKIAQKDIVVIPKTQEVILYSDPIGFKRLR